jgi:hypothetical protein
MIKKAQSGMTMKAKAKVKSKADQYDSKPLPKPGKQTPADFMPKSYDTRFKPVKGGGTGNEYLKLGPREKTPGGGFSRNGSKIKKAKVGGSFPDLNKDGKISQADVLIGKGVLPKKAKMGKSVKKKAMMGTDMSASPMMKKGGTMKKCKYGCK